MITKLQGVHPTLALKAELIVDVMQQLGHPVLITDGLRTLAQQQALYAKGRTAPGKIVTYADGIKAKSNHQARTVDGFGHAVDFAFLKDGKPSWSDSHPWRLLGEMAKALGLRWGGDWTGLVDRPHVELP